MDGNVAQEEILSIASGILVLSPLEQSWGLGKWNCVQGPEV